MQTIPIMTPRFRDALCADRSVTPDPDIFNPEDDDPSKEQKTRAAQEICVQCPHQTECMLYAVANREEGVWGGTTGRQRRRMRQTDGYRPRIAGARPYGLA